MPLLFCNAVLVLHAQPNGIKVHPVAPHNQYMDAMRVRYDTAKHCVVWPQHGDGSTMFDMKNFPPPALPQLSNNSTVSTFHLTKDLNAEKDSNPYNFSFTSTNSQFAVLNNISYFSADDGIHGGELWRSDGTATGTYLVKDINPGTASSNVFDIIAANGKIYFDASTAAEGQEIWVSDGTETGTKLLKDIITGTENGSPSFLVATNNTVFFTTPGTSYFFSSQLWKTDGTTAGTVLVKDLNTAADNYTNAAFQFSSANGLLYFTATSYTNGRELWRSDGTTAGTFMIKDINPITYDYDGPTFLTAYNNHLYFLANDGTGRKLWLTDGTSASTVVAPGGNGVTFEDGFFFQNMPFQVIGNTMYMKAATGATGFEMYKYNATNSDGIVLLKDITPGPGGTTIDNYNITSTASVLFFVVTNADGSYSLWGSKDGPNGALVVKNFGVQEYVNNLTNCYGTLFFSKYDNTNGYELWKSDATAAGTVLIADINPGNHSSSPYNFTPANNKVLFRAATLSNGIELWRTDGTTAGTQQVRDINKTSTSSSYVNSYTGSQAVLPNGIIYAANTPQYGTELYRSDGTLAGTSLIADILPGENGGDLRDFTAKGNNVYFTSSIYTSGSASRKIYKTNGKAVIKLIELDYSNYNINNIAVTDNEILFYNIFNNYTGQNELWRTDGTPAGNYQVYAGFNYTNYIVASGNTVYFSGNDNTNGTELWKSDGTIAGTHIVKDIVAGTGNSSLYSFFVFNSSVYFGVTDPFTGLSGFWKSDGTAAGTIKLADVTPYYGNSFSDVAQHFCVSGNTLYFNGSSADYGIELWKTNGTVAGTKIVKDIYPGGFGSFPVYLTDVNGRLFFMADDGVHGSELWTSNGSINNTVLVKDIAAGIGGTYTNGMCSAAGKCFFTSNNYLWSSDGLAAGTNAVSDPALADVTYVTGFIANGNKLFFGGYSYQYGQELYEGDASLVSFASVKSEQQDAVITKSASFDAKISSNPVTANATLQLTGDVKNAGITLSDMNGKVLWSSMHINTLQVKLPVEKLLPGMYIVSIENGLINKTIRFIKQ